MNNKTIELIDIAKLIYEKVKAMEKGREMLDGLSDRKAELKRDYKKKLALTNFELNDCKEYEYEGKKYKKPCANSITKIAEGICADDIFEFEKVEGQYKTIITKLESIQVEINGLQSIFKYFADM